MGPLSGIRIIEFEAIGPAPYCGMLLSDLGADVILVEQAAVSLQGDPEKDFTRRGKRSIMLDLKYPADLETARKLCRGADALIEGRRPGAMERLGLGPDELMADNPGLVYGRITGWGQDGPLSTAAGHDINYVALSGLLGAMGEKDRPPLPPLNVVGDYGGGALFLVVGILSALIARHNTGKGQVIDAAITDGTASLSTLFYGLLAQGRWNLDRGSNLLDGSAPYYRCYETKDGKYVSIGAIEPRFYSLLLDKLGLDPGEFEPQNDPSRWPDYTARFAAIFKSRTREEWCELLEGTDACFAPVLDFAEAARHPHNLARKAHVEGDGLTMPAASPRFSATPAADNRDTPAKDQHRAEILAEIKSGAG
ncbi:CaiB/BaiF CoA transferase family protein [Emcibacter nanhaiensis]|uniref:CoA transferase n=1 Tax=Emcibacter nanhaiensis TaxID=1505037 RepID=A0A501PGN5_9PROT|nr:CaiB/BaiF CoA-transferase family protein [Emcibacter nanhaiensis]TPD59026.1 CoA transferase [Emcibacter nanhaiensis]